MSIDSEKTIYQPAPTSPTAPTRKLSSKRNFTLSPDFLERSASPAVSVNLSRHATRVPQHDVDYLRDDEIDKFIDDLDHNGDGQISYKEIEEKLDQVHHEITPKPLDHHTLAEDKDEAARHAFLRSMLGDSGHQSDRLSRDEFKDLVRGWHIPSMKQEQEEEEEQNEYMRKLPKWRRFRSWWSVYGPKVLFIAFVVVFELAFGLWQMIKYIRTEPYRAALGWGVVVAKTSAGFLYPTMFFVVLSMSRYFATFLRRSYRISKFINWDLSQKFHVAMSILALFLATLHSIGHLTGSFVFGSMADRQEAVGEIVGQGNQPGSYAGFVRLRPGYTGLAALIVFYTMAALSMPRVRRWNYELFQLGHLLMFPFLALLMVHGTLALLQYPMMGFFLAFPTLMVIIERSIRVFLGFRRIPATLTILDDDTSEVSVKIPESRMWDYRAGQYIFLQVPAISFFQWHPFTVSECVGKDMKVHIKAGGDWTGKLKGLAKGEKSVKIHVGVNGPFGAPAQRFYDYSHTLLVGSGIGVTPFSGILRDLQTRDDQAHGGPSHRRQVQLHRQDSSASNSPALSRSSTRSNSNPISRVASRVRVNKESKQATYANDYRRVDFHWSVRDKTHLMWFTDLLNSISRSQSWHKEHDPSPHLDIRIQTHVTQQRKSISTHIYRWLLELHRTEEHPESPLTGLVNSTHFGRPDFVKILDAHYEDMVMYMRTTGADREKLKVGVFYCGTPVVGEILADRCRLLTAKGVTDRTGIRYIFMTEVFE